jgi:hypothetical protein
MILTVTQLVQAAMRDAKLLKMGEAASPNEVAGGMLDLNMLLDDLGTQSIMVMAAIMEHFSLTAGKVSYTIGLGGDFNTTMPTNITDAFIQDNANLRYPVAITDLSLYRTYPDALISSSRPEEIAFDPGPTQQTNRLGVIFTYPVPDASMPYTLYIGEQKELTEFSAVGDVVSFQQGYYLFLRSLLAELLWGQFQDGPVPANIRSMRSRSAANITAMNTRPGTAMIDMGRKGRGYNIYQGPYSGGYPGGGSS